MRIFIIIFHLKVPDHLSIQLIDSTKKTDFYRILNSIDNYIRDF